MKILVELAHPKHYYQFRAVLLFLEKNGHEITLLARDKDVLLKILQEENRPYLIYGRHGKSMFQKFFALPMLLLTYYRIARRQRPDMLVSKASPYAVIISWFYKVKTVITPDSEVVTLTNKFVAPASTAVITPATYGLDFGQKHKRFSGFFEDCYLHPSIFEPQKGVVEKMNPEKGKPYFILRFISWNANHDVNNYGFTADEKRTLVGLLQPYGSIFISSEGALPEELEPYRIKIPANQMHTVLHHAALYIGDSQTMATEAALLGTPSIRYNSFVGPNDMSNFIILEQKFDLLRNCASFQQVLDTAGQLLAADDTKTDWLRKRADYYAVAGDVNQQIVSFLLAC